MNENDSPIANQKFAMITYIDDKNIKLANKLDNNEKNKYNLCLNEEREKNILSGNLAHINANNYKSYGFFDTCEEAIKYVDSLNYKIRSSFDKYDDAINYANNLNYEVHGCFDTYEEAMGHADELRKKKDDYIFYVVEINE